MAGDSRSKRTRTGESRLSGIALHVGQSSARSPRSEPSILEEPSHEAHQAQLMAECRALAYFDVFEQRRNQRLMFVTLEFECGEARFACGDHAVGSPV